MKKILSLLVLFPLVVVQAQTTTNNYVKTTTYKEASTTSITVPTVQQASQNVTYFDGLGRPVQQVAYQQSPTGNDIVTPMEYDGFGRQEKAYLPYVPSVPASMDYKPSALADVLSFYDNTKYDTDFPGMTTNDINPYSQKGFEASPLNRVSKQAAPGKDWKLGNGHEIKLDYQANLDNEVKNFGVSLVFADNTYTPTLTQSAVNNGFYNANELYKTITFDENTAATPTELNGSTVEFKNKQGQVLLKRTYGTVGIGTTNEKHDTYYVYDDYGNLSFVIPPKAADIINIGTASIPSNLPYSGNGSNLSLIATNSITLTNFYVPAGSTFTATIVSGGNSTLEELCYQYKYDHRNRLVEKKLPGKQWEFILYDKLDRVVATGPAFSPFNDTAVGVVGWLITKYDVFNRPVYTGWELSATVNSSDRILKQNALNSATVFNEGKQASGTIDGIAAYYTKTTVNPTSFKLLMVNYYDDYAYPNVPSIPATVENQTVLATTEVKGLATGSWTRIPTSSSAIQGETATTFYDQKARPVRSYIQNFLGGYTYSDSKLDFPGKPDYSITYHKRDSNSNSAVLKTKDVFTYSTQGRLLVQTHQINDGTVETIAENNYDELGQLTSKAVGGNTQKVDYTYNIRGWLKSINNAVALQQSGDPIDLFAFAINYNTTSANISGVNALYNGNIAETQWITNSDGVLRTYGYKYDNLNRLTQGIYKKANTVTNAYDESMDYDKNGNIMHLNRFGSLNDITPTQIDNLTYDYKNSNTSNQLMKVSDVIANNPGFKDEFKDSAANATDDYTYDANGNMIKDNNKNITGITYNQLNLPTKITFASTGNIVYIYNAAGQKVQKEVNRTGLPAETTDYLGGYQYNDATNSIAILKFFPTAEGYVEPSGSSFKYVYQYKDHLGNVRLSYDKNLNIQEENNYYPFGLKQTGYNTVAIASDYKYKYNGKELQDELGLNLYDYGARNYDPALGRWMNVDPLAETSRRFSPYTYALNNPVFFIDPDGMEATPMDVDYSADTSNYKNQTFAITDWVEKDNGDIYWDNSANSQGTTKAGETYLGKTLTFNFNSYIDAKLWDGPMGNIPAGDKLTSTINITGHENSKGELTGISATKSIKVGETPIGEARDYYPGKGGSNNTASLNRTSTGYNFNFEQHASVSSFEEFGMNSMGYKIVDVAQKLNINYNNSNGNLSVSAYTGVFPSATLSVNGSQIMKYNQPSFTGTHTAQGSDFSYYPSNFYKRL